MGHGPQIPLTPLTDERNFPRHTPNAPPGQSGANYPKMLTKPCTRDDRDAWLEKHRQTDQITRQEFYYDRVPKVGDPIPVETTMELVDAGFAITVGVPVTIESAEDEETILEMLGMKAAPPPRAPSVGIPIRAQTDNDLAEENARLRRLLADKPKPQRRKKAKMRHTSAGKVPVGPIEG